MTLPTAACGGSVAGVCLGGVIGADKALPELGDSNAPVRRRPERRKRLLKGPIRRAAPHNSLRPLPHAVHRRLPPAGPHPLQQPLHLSLGAE